jgi:hypothetical protein
MVLDVSNKTCYLRAYDCLINLVGTRIRRKMVIIYVSTLLYKTDQLWTTFGKKQPLILYY